MLSSISSSEQSHTAGARALLLSFFASGLLCVLLLAGASEWLIRAHVLPQDTQAAHLRLLNARHSADAAFGDSHAARGFDAQDGFVNLAYPSENIKDMAAKVAFYFAEHAPGRVLLQADPHLFAPYRVHAGQKHYEVAPTYHFTSNRHRPRVLGYWNAYLRAGGRLESKVTMTTSGSLLSEGDLSALAPRRRQIEARERRDWHTIAPSTAAAEAQARYALLLDDLTARGAEICLVSYPVSQDYAAAVATAGHAAQVEFFKVQAERIGARFVDARAMVSDRAQFRDVDHLNSAGAIAFSPRLLSACFDATAQAHPLQALHSGVALD